MQVDFVIEEVEICTKYKHVTMSRSRAAEQINQDCSGDDLIDIIDNSSRHGEGWRKTSEILVLSLDEDQSQLTQNCIVLSDGFESDEESAQLTSCLDSEDEPLDLSLHQYLGLKKSPALPCTPLTSTSSLSRSQDPSPSVIDGAKASLETVIGQSKKECARTSSDSEGLVVIDGEAEGPRDGDLSDDSDDSVCSMASGPSKPAVYQGLCARCLGLHMRMTRLTSWTKSKVKDPACLDYDQWRLLKPWHPRGRYGYRREKGKLFNHLPLIRRRAAVRAEGDPENECEPCTRPHVFLQRNLWRCQRALSGVLKHIEVKKKARSRRRRVSGYSLPPLNGRTVKRKHKVISTEGSAKKKSIREEHGRREEHERRRRRRSDKETRRTDEDGHHSCRPLTFNATSDCSAKENAVPGRDGCMDAPADTQTSGCPATQGDLNALSRATAQSRPPAEAPCAARNARGAMQNGREDRSLDVKTGQSRAEYDDGHGRKCCSRQGWKGDEHTGVGTCKYPVGLSAVKQPIICLHRCDSTDGNIRTGKEMERTRQAPQTSASYPQKCTEGCTDSDVKAITANRYAGDHDICVNNAKNRQTRSYSGTVLNGRSKVSSRIDINRPRHTNDHKVLDGCHLDMTEDFVPLDDTGWIQRALPLNGAPKKVPPATPIWGFSKVTGAARVAKSRGQLAQPPCEEEDPYTFRTSTPPGEEDPYAFRTPTPPKEEDPYAFRTPTPPEVQTSEPVRKLRPFARTYVASEVKPNYFRSMLCTLDRSCSTVVREIDQ
ncbi:hypothetical protein ACEWY4_016429 [Coilia grayii]|uniref:Uncharacterized protein n=1 Tax=Coilia grayii TaxID=363190 RepID=A0ABD1JLJ1_9TELE